MKKLSIFKLFQHEGAYDSWPQSTELIKNNIATGKEIPGFFIEAQYEHKDGYLLVTSWDCPFEEAQTFLLLSFELDIVFEKTIGAAYATVLMENHEPINDIAVKFHFDGDLDILATLDITKKLILEQSNSADGKKWPT